MPKKSGVNKTYSFSQEVVDKLNEICKREMRSQTNVLEVLITERWTKLCAQTVETRR